MINIRSDVAEVHAKGMRAAEMFKLSSAELIDVLQWMDQERGYLDFNCTSLFQYANKELKLSEDVSCGLIAIARKSQDVPELKEAVRSGAVVVSKARKLVSVITPSNQERWLKLASESSSRVVEREVARANPKAAVNETIRYLTGDRLEARFGLSERLYHSLQRATDLVAKKFCRPISLEELIEAMTDEYLKRHDHVLKAKRAIGQTDGECRKGSVLGPIAPGQDEMRAEVLLETKNRRPGRRRIRASIRHQVNARDEGQCTVRDPMTGERCANKRWTELHHVIPVASGGADEVVNLVTLCSVHHRKLHDAD